MWRSLRRALARLLFRIAERLRGNPQADLPTVAELVALPFDDVWSRLLACLAPWRVTRLDLAVYRGRERSTEYSWSDPADGESRHCAWSLGVSFPRADGRRCELQATTFGSAMPDHWAMLALTRILQIFAARFAIHAEPDFGLTLLRADETPAAEFGTYLEEAA